MSVLIDDQAVSTVFKNLNAKIWYNGIQGQHGYWMSELSNERGEVIHTSIGGDPDSIKLDIATVAAFTFVMESLKKDKFCLAHIGS